HANHFRLLRSGRYLLVALPRRRPPRAFGFLALDESNIGLDLRGRVEALSASDHGEEQVYQCDEAHGVLPRVVVVEVMPDRISEESHDARVELHRPKLLALVRAQSEPRLCGAEGV